MRISFGPRKINKYMVRKIAGKKLLGAILSAMVLIVMGFNVGFAQEKEPFVYDDHGQRDPLWPLVSSSGTILNYSTEFLISDLVLEGIMAGEDGQNYAIINGSVLKASDSIGPFIVDRIDDNRIILKKGRQKIELKLKKEE